MDDPSLLVDVGAVWSARGEKAAVLRGENADPREHLLVALGRASLLCPRIERSLRAPTHEGYDLDGAGAHEFLTLRTTALEQAGFGMLVPAWRSRKGGRRRHALRVRVSSPSFARAAGLSMTDLVSFRWEAALGGEPLSREELVALARLRSPLVRLRDR